MKKILLDPLLRRDLGMGISNAAIGLVVAIVTGIAASLWWIGVLAATGTFLVAAADDRGQAGSVLPAAVGGLFLVVLVGLWVASGSVLGVVPVVLIGTGVGFGANRLLFGVVFPVPESRRQR
ncbi:MAG: hypothetical protein V5A21_06440 [Halapricum sp.]